MTATMATFVALPWAIGARYLSARRLRPPVQCDGWWRVPDRRSNGATPTGEAILRPEVVPGSGSSAIRLAESTGPTPGGVLEQAGAPCEGRLVGDGGPDREPGHDVGVVGFGAGIRP